MKRCDQKRRKYLTRIACNRFRRKHRRRYRAIRERAHYHSYTSLKAPCCFSLFDQKARTRTVRFLNELRNTAMLQKQSISIDFSDTRKMVADGALLFLSELRRLLRILPVDIQIRCCPPKSLKIAQVLKQIGVYRLLKYRSKVMPFDQDVVHWRVANGKGAEGEKYNEILGHYDGVIPEAMAEGLYLGLTEAMTNVHHHAYIETRKDGLNQEAQDSDWWMFSQQKDGRLAVVFCDLGIGIPGSLPTQSPTLWQRLSKYGECGDGRLIEEAVHESRTRTKKHYRGKGLKQLAHVIEKFEGGRLAIHSNRGCYTINDNEESSRDYKESILGTIITWSVPI